MRNDPAWLLVLLLTLVATPACFPIDDGTGRGGGGGGGDDDDAASDDDDDATDDDDAAGDGSIVFKTSAGYPGDLTAPSGEATGLAGGDALCQLAADAANLDGTFVAWLSTGTVDAIDRIDDVGPWYTTTGQLAFNNAAGLAGTTQASIERDEYGVVNIDSAWTGTLTGGRAADERCGDWESEFGDGHTGNGVSSWTDSTDRDCGEQHPLYCFQQ